MRVLDLFSGIGGFSLGLERAGFKTVAFCEIEDYPRKVLAKHWPGVPIYDDVRTLTADRLAGDGITGIDVITGGFPCQDLSVAGKQAGMGEGTRSGLWSEIARLIGELRPRYALMENVTALISGDSGRWFGRVLGDLASLGYDAEWHCIPASELGAHHHRDRVWIIAYTGLPEPSGRIQASQGQQPGQRREAWGEPASLCCDVADSPQLLCNGDDYHRENGAGEISEPGNRGCSHNVADTDSAQRQRDECPIGILAEYADFGRSSWWATEPDVGRVANGIPHRAHRLKGLGNAIVPQIPELIGRAIMEVETKKASEDA